MPEEADQPAESTPIEIVLPSGPTVRVPRGFDSKTLDAVLAVLEKPPQPIDKGLPGPGLLANVITGKYGDHPPLYRQEDILSRHGVTLSRATLCEWMARAAEVLRPLHDVMAGLARSSKVIWTDDTTVPVWDPTLPATRIGRFLVYVGDDWNPFRVYDFTPRRTRDGPERFLGSYQGYLQADAFSGYDRICTEPGVIKVACWAHVRRKFYECRTTAPVLAHEALARIRQLYRIEAECRALPAAKPREIRQRDAVPLLAAFEAWLDEQCRQMLPKSPLGKAIAYARNQWQGLQTYTRDGELSIDNNLAERTLRAQAIGRMNYLFVGSDRGGRTAAVLYSFVGSCRRLGADSFAYLRDVLERLPTHPAERLGELLPDAWFVAHPNARRKVAS
ncbi:IS66 family transposase [Tautonia plasticadhaerens]|uniref:IS66 family transposase n=1 Tax=Tautonia plasticadhaerens TaxID=2527974 RepID=UPI0018D23172|nr:IS66 family transposase [Tautonia plasticadhaerens]